MLARLRGIVRRIVLRSLTHTGVGEFYPTVYVVLWRPPDSLPLVEGAFWHERKAVNVALKARKEMPDPDWTLELVAYAATPEHIEYWSPE